MRIQSADNVQRQYFHEINMVLCSILTLDLSDIRTVHVHTHILTLNHSDILYLYTYQKDILL